MRDRKSKGSQFEYKCKESLEEYYKETSYKILLTKELGFQEQYDLKIELEKESYIAIECKNQKYMSWNQRVKYLDKLISKTKDAVGQILIFKEKYKPVFIMEYFYGIPVQKKFEDYFKIKFKRYKDARKRNKKS